MNEKIEALKQEITSYEVGNQNELEQYRCGFISRKSVIGDLFGEMKTVAPEERKAMGVRLNDLKNTAQSKFKELIASLEEQKNGQPEDVPDLTLPSIPDTLGAIHPLTQIQNRVVEIFERMGFNVAEGPEIEDDFHNFTALNFPTNHPAREMQDTFFIEKNSGEDLPTFNLGSHGNDNLINQKVTD